MKKYFPLLKNMSQFAHFSDESLMTLLDKAELLEIKKNFILYKEGDTDDSVYVLLKGLLKSCYTLENKAFTEYIFIHGDIIANISSLFLTEDSRHSIVAITNSTIIKLSKKHLIEYLQTDNSFQYTVYEVISNYFNAYILRARLIMSYSTSLERFKIFLERYGMYIDHISNKDAASYLGITPETLSRLKRQYFNLNDENPDLELKKES